MQLIFATSNAHKLKEILSITPPGIKIMGLVDIGFQGDIPETRDTIEGNSLQKAEFIASRYKLPCFSEDTGLEIEALNGEPGVYSARYAGENGEQPTFEQNVQKVLKNMTGITNRRARFKTVITYFNGSTFVQFEGITEGQILNKPSGSAGFGYDPIFKPNGYDKTYAEMSLEEKNLSSHRKKSFALFANHLSNISV